jgi:hypothetical protein
MRHALLSGTWFLFGYIDRIGWQETQSPTRHVPTRPQLMRAASCELRSVRNTLAVVGLVVQPKSRNKQATNKSNMYSTAQHSMYFRSSRVQVRFRSGALLFPPCRLPPQVFLRPSAAVGKNRGHLPLFLTAHRSAAAAPLTASYKQASKAGHSTSPVRQARRASSLVKASLSLSPPPHHVGSMDCRLIIIDGPRCGIARPTVRLRGFASIHQLVSCCLGLVCCGAILLF